MTQHTRARSLRAFAFAVVIALGGASTALATSTSSGVSETYTIAASVTIANVPSTGTFAAPPVCFPTVGECLATDYSYSFITTIGSNNGSGLTVDVLATAPTSGSNVIPVTTRAISFGSPVGFTRTAPAGLNLGALDPTVPLTLGTIPAPGSVAIPVEPILRVDANSYPAGAYSSTFTVRATTNP